MTLAIAQGTLPPVSVETTQMKKKAKAAPAKKAEKQPEQPAAGVAKDANPYADPQAPYKVDRSGSGKLTEPLVNTPRTVTAIPKQVIDDTAVKSVRELARQVPGVTLGFGEGGNAFGDRIYIRGFDARGDIYVDGIRDPGNASREVFAVQQVEIMKGPASTLGGRSTAGGAVNIIPKKANETENFFNVSQMFGTDNTFRTTLDINRVIGPGLAVRGNLLFHTGEVAGRDVVEDERWGGYLSAVMNVSENIKVSLDYYRYRTNGIPDFGVPLNTTAKLPWTETGVSRRNWYGDAYRDFTKNSQDVFTATVEAKLSPYAKLTSKTRYGMTVVDYIATGPNGVGEPANDLTTITVASGSARYQEAELFLNQTELTFKFDTSGLKHTMVAGIEVGREDISRWGYGGINTLTAGGSFVQNLFNPNHHPGAKLPDRAWTFDATIETRAAYLLDTVELNKQWLVNGGVRIDNVKRTQDAAAAGNIASVEDTLFNSMRASSTSRSPSPASTWPTARRRPRWAASSMRPASTTAASASISHSSSRSGPRASSSAPSGSCSAGACWPPPRCSSPRRRTGGRAVSWRFRTPTGASPRPPATPAFLPRPPAPIASAASSWGRRATSRRCGACSAASSRWTPR
jgi:catecholate siderophore receptor